MPLPAGPGWPAIWYTETGMDNLRNFAPAAQVTYIFLEANTCIGRMLQSMTGILYPDGS